MNAQTAILETPAQDRPAAVVRTPDPFYSIGCIEEAAERAGNHFFTPGAKRFFNSRISDTIYRAPDGSAYFVTSERPPYGPRAYTVRHARHDADGFKIETVGGFMAHANRGSAHRAACRAAVGF